MTKSVLYFAVFLLLVTKTRVKWRRGSATAEGPHDVPYYQICAMFYDVWELERFQTANVTFKVIQGHNYN